MEKLSLLIEAVGFQLLVAAAIDLDWTANTELLFDLRIICKERSIHSFSVKTLRLYDLCSSL